MTHSVCGKSWLRAALRTSVATSALIAGMTMSAYAQDDNPTGTKDTIVVTGTRIPLASNLDSSSPITALNSDEFSMRGTTKVEDIINTLPQAFAAQGSSISNGSSGTATINLRGLGSDRTLVLIDGKRMPYGSAPYTTAADVNQVPAALVDRVEVVTGGASAVYGSDAMAGVVNFIMKRDFEGLRFDGQFSFYQHDNTDARAATILQRAGYVQPDSSVLDGFGKNFSVIAGANSPDGRGNVTAYFVYHHNNQVIEGNRDYSACAYGGGGAPDVDGLSCVGSSTTDRGRFTDFGFAGGFDLDLDPASGNFVPRNGRTFNYAPYNHYLRPDERFLIGSFSHYELNKYADVYMDLMFHDDRTAAQIAPSGSFFTVSTLNCGNPLMSGQQAAAIGCSAGDIAANNSVLAFVGKRNVEGGARIDDLRHTSFRGVFGVKGETGIEGFTYDVYGLWANVHMAENYVNDLSTTRMRRALNVIADPRLGPNFGQPVCQSVVDGTDPACVPWNLFTPGGVTQAVENYIQVPGFADANTTQQVVNGAVNIDLGPYEGRTPWAKDSIKAVLGADFRRDTMDFRSDLTFCDRAQPTPNSDLAGQGGASCPVSGAQQVYEGFVEMRLPLVQDKTFIRDLSGDFGYRYSSYKFGGATHTWKLLGDYSPTDDIRFRGGWQRAVRAPNVIELFNPRRIALFDLDPGEGCGNLSVLAGQAFTPAQCTNTGLAVGDYPAPDNPAGQYNSLIHGSTDLRPETADTYTVGAVLTPGFAKNLMLSVDYFNIKVLDFISNVSAETSINQCALTGDPYFCSAIHRDSVNSLWVTPQGYVDAGNINTGSLSTDGLDINASYSFDMEDLGAAGWGSWDFDLVGTYLLSLVTEELPGFTPYDCAGYRGSVCGTPNPKWRHKFRATYHTPWKLDVSVSWRYFSAVNDFSESDYAGNIPGEDYPAQEYLDISTHYQLMDNVQLRAGVNNILDTDPPVSTDVGAGFGNGNTYPQVYDALGRYFFFSATVDF